MSPFCPRTTEYDERGRVSATTDADDLRTETEYYADGQVKRTRQIPLTGDPTPWTTYEYDAVVELRVGGTVESSDQFTITMRNAAGQASTLTITANTTSPGTLADTIVSAFNTRALADEQTGGLFANITASKPSGAD